MRRIPWSRSAFKNAVNNAVMQVSLRSGDHTECDESRGITPSESALTMRQGSFQSEAEVT